MNAMNAFVDAVADRIVKKIAPMIRNGHVRPKTKLDMRCRVPGCKERSRGPRFFYVCLGHEKLPKKTKRAFLKKYNEAKS